MKPDKKILDLLENMKKEYETASRLEKAAILKQIKQTADLLTTSVTNINSIIDTKKKN